MSGDAPPWTPQSDEHYVRDISGKEIAVYSSSSLQFWNIWGLDNVGKINADTTRNYYLKDHLGSIRVVLNSTNTVISAQDYDSWGYPLENRTYNVTSIKYDFTGKERDDETSYDYFGARYYDSRIGRWEQVDPQFSDLPGWTPYRAFLDNPINISDPDGKIEIPEKYRNDYSKLVTYLEKNLVKIGTERESLDAYKEISDLTEDQIREGLEINNRKGPVLNITELGTDSWGRPILGKTDAVNNILYLDVDYANELQKSKGENLEVMQFLITAIILHEGAHFAYHKSSQANKDEYLKKYSTTEHGDLYESIFFKGSVTQYNDAVTVMNNRNFLADKAKRYEYK